MTTTHTTLDHIGFVVPDLERAMAELGTVFGVEWAQPVSATIGDWKTRFTLSASAETPYVEICEGSPDSPWDGSSGPRLDHLAVRLLDVASERERLKEQGLPVVVDLRPFGFDATYHEAKELGVRIEVVSKPTT